MSDIANPRQIRLERRSPSYWRVTFDYPPLNIFGLETKPVMFCDLVGSTALSTRHDPEDLRELIGDYHRAVTETVGRFDGFVAKYMDDDVLIYFDIRRRLRTTPSGRCASPSR